MTSVAASVFVTRSVLFATLLLLPCLQCMVFEKIPKDKVILCNAGGECVTEGAREGCWEAACTAGCHSCMFHDQCHCRFTDPKVACPIPGWRSDLYCHYHSQGCEKS